MGVDVLLFHIFDIILRATRITFKALEVDTELADAQRAQLLEDGYVILPNLISQQELDALLASNAAFTPYLPEQIAGTSSGSALVGSMDWNSYHFFRDGKPIAANHDLCPVAAGLVEQVPFPHAY